MRLWSSVTLLYTLSSVMTLCSLAGMYQPHYTVSIKKNTSFFLVHGASTQTVINDAEYFKENRRWKGFSEWHTMLINMILHGQRNHWGLFGETDLEGNMFLCSPLCIHSLKAQWKAKELAVSRVCHQCLSFNMLSSPIVHFIYGKAKQVHSQHLSWKYA
jgi:hypothetical protein